MTCAWCAISGPNAGLQPLEGSGCSFCTCCAETVRAMATLFERRGMGLEEIIQEVSRRFSWRKTDKAPIVTNETQ